MKLLLQALPKDSGHHSRVYRPLATAMLALSVLLLAPAVAYAQSNDAQAAVQRMFDAQNRKDLSGVLAQMTDDFVQDGGACNAGLNKFIRCEGKAAFAKAFGPADSWPSQRMVGTPQLDADTMTSKIEVRFAAFPELLHVLGVERLAATITARARGSQLYYVRYELDQADAQTTTVLSQFGAPPAQDGRSIFDEPAATQDLFGGTWGNNASQRWVTEHNAELKRLGV
jgi:hypothetical protein